jgi:hypothetical protein
MKTKSEHPSAQNSERGNALIYVLIAIALFAALSFAFTRQNRNQSTSELDVAKGDLYTTQLLTYATQVQSVIDQMTITGTKINDLDFKRSGDIGFETAPHGDKVFHPAGGGLLPFNLPANTTVSGLTPPAGAYLGLFNNTEWTATAQNDIMFSAFGITRALCENLNTQITGSNTIPAVNGNIAEYFVDASYHSANQNFDIADCADCEDKLALCVSDSGGSTFAFYVVIAPR